MMFPYRSKYEFFAILFMLSTTAFTYGQQLNDDTASKDWQYSSKIDAMTDVTTVSACKRGDAGLLSIDCKVGDKDSVTVLIGTDKPLGSNQIDRRDLIYRLDQNPAVRTEWTYSGRAAMLTNTDQSVDLLIPMMKAKKLLARMYSYDGVATDIIFNVDGTSTIINKLLDDCKIRQKS